MAPIQQRPKGDETIDSHKGALWSVNAVRLLSIGAEWQTEVAGGVNRYTYGLADALAGLGVEQQWVFVGDNPIAEGYGVTAAAPPSAMLLKRMVAIRGRTQEFAGNADLVTTHFALNATPALSACKSLPHVCHFHGPWAAESAVEGASMLSVAAKRWLERRVYRSADRVITLSRAFADLVNRDYGVDENKVRVIPGGVEVERWTMDIDRELARKQLGWPTDRPIVFCVRRLARRMGLENLVDAVKQLRDRHPEILVMIGGGGGLREELQSRIEASSLEHNVRLLGFVPENDLPLAYRAADLSVVPTQSLEGFGLIVLESLASGTPALVTPIGGLPEVVEGFAPQLVLEAASVEAIAEGIDAGLSGSITLPSSEECQQYVRKNFAWPTIAQRVLAVYEEARR